LFASEGYISVGSFNYTVELNDENGNPLGVSYCAPFNMFGGNFALTIVASGFLDPSQNSDGSPFGLYIVDHFNGVLFPLEVGPCPIAPNDIPCNAAQLIVNDPPITSNNEWATIDQGETTPPNLNFNDPEADCITQWCDGALDNSVWFRFTAPASGNALVSTCHDVTIDTQVAVYTVSDCGDYGTFTYIAANDDTDGGCGGGDTYASTLQLDGLTSGAEYFVQVDGWGATTGDFQISVEDIVSVNEINNLNWTMYPNPADQQVQFTGVPVNSIASIFDLAGKLVKSVKLNSTSAMDVSDVSSGVYTVQILHNGELSNGKLIIE
jgi:Secretion system C-terminal sorting domain